MGKRRGHGKMSDRKKRNRDEHDNHPNRPDNEFRFTNSGPNQFSNQFTLFSDSFNNYYRGHIIPESEWEDFMATVRKPLPTTFRFQSSEAFGAIDEFERTWLKAFDGVNVGQEHGVEVTVDPPRPIPWYPERKAWRFNIDRHYLRKHPELKKFQRWLVCRTSQGVISRQEEVSMIPVLFLKAHNGLRVIDMCAAPGSKTSQIIDTMTPPPGHGEPEGLIVANDADYKRCNLLGHQTLRRCVSPILVVTCHEGQMYPTLYEQGTSASGKRERMQFDRVLADVPCSGDGTMRKNPDVWTQWNEVNGLGLHRLQASIMYRAVGLLKVGGRMVYSTCSMNPIENEAIVAHILRQNPGMRLVDCSADMPSLVRRPGLSTWRVVSKGGVEFKALSEVPESLEKQIPVSCFPPTAEEAQQFHLERCMRVYPHLQDSGGFFVAVLEKTDDRIMLSSGKVIMRTDLDDREEAAAPAAAAQEDGDAAAATPAAAAPAPAAAQEGGDAAAAGGVKKDEPQKNQRGPRGPHVKGTRFRPGDAIGVDELTMLNENAAVLKGVIDAFGLNLANLKGQFLSRTAEAKRMGYVSKELARYLSCDREAKLNIVNIGVRFALWQSINSPQSCGYRLAYEGLTLLQDHVTKRIFQGTKEEFKEFMTKPLIMVADMNEHLRSVFEAHTEGSLVGLFDFRMPGSSQQFGIPIWRGKSSMAQQIPSEDIEALREMLGWKLIKTENPADGTAAAAATTTSTTTTGAVPAAANDDNDDDDDDDRDDAGGESSASKE